MYYVDDVLLKKVNLVEFVVEYGWLGFVAVCMNAVEISEKNIELVIFVAI